MPLEFMSSPFYHTRKIICAFRFFFGYPLCPTNDEFTEFVFRTPIEYVKIIAYTTIASVNILYMIALYCVSSYSGAPGGYIDAENIIKFYNEHLGGMGYSKLDLAMVFVTNYANIVSNLFFFKSFQNNCTKITDICKRITVAINSIEYNCKEKDKLRHVSFKHLARRSTKLLLCAECLYLVAFGSYAYGLCYVYTRFDYQKYLPETSVNIYLGTKITLVLFAIYPATVASGEFVIYHSFSIIEEAFSRWNCLLYKKDEEKALAYSNLNSYGKSPEKVNLR